MSPKLRTPKRWGKAAGFSAALLIATAALAIPSASAATRAPIYNNIPSTLPGNVPSVGFEATSASEFGGQVSFEGTARTNPTVKVVMSSWGCQGGTVTGNNCSTTPGATFTEPLTVRAYSVKGNNEPGTLIGAVTHTFAMPYRPSANFTRCFGADAGKWFKAGTCYNGLAFARTFSMGSLDLPNKVILSVAYNTSHNGYDPIGEDACYTQDGGCGYDSLNVGTSGSPTTAGTQPVPNDAYQNSSQGSMYCDGGTPGGTGTFRLDATCWGGFQPAFTVTAN